MVPAQQAQHSRLSTAGSAQQALHSRLCTAGSAQQALHSRLCTACLNTLLVLFGLGEGRKRHTL